MISLTDLNTTDTLSFTDNRPYGIVTNINYGKDLDFEYTSDTFTIQHTCIVEEIIGGSSANLRLEINTADSSITPQIAYFPAGVTSTTVGTKTTFFGIDSLEDYEVVKAAQITLPTGYEGSFGYTVRLIWDTPSQVNNQIRWEVGQTKYAADLQTSCTLECDLSLIVSPQIELESAFQLPPALLDYAVWNESTTDIDYYTNSTDIYLTDNPTIIDDVPFEDAYWVVRVTTTSDVVSSITYTTMPGSVTFSYGGGVATLVATAANLADLNTGLGNLRIVLDTVAYEDFTIQWIAFTNSDGSTNLDPLVQSYIDIQEAYYVNVTNSTVTRTFTPPTSTTSASTNIFATSTPQLVPTTVEGIYDLEITGQTLNFNKSLISSSASQINSYLSDDVTLTANWYNILDDIGHTAEVNGTITSLEFSSGLNGYSTHLSMDGDEAVKFIKNDNIDFDLSGNFTIDLYFLKGTYSSDILQIPDLKIRYETGAGYQNTVLYIDGVSRITFDYADLDDGNFVYIGVQRTGSTYYFYHSDNTLGDKTNIVVNGTTYTHGSTLDHSPTGTISEFIGDYSNANKIDEVRFSNSIRLPYSGTSRPDGNENISEPTEYNSAFEKDSNTLLLIHFDDQYPATFDADFVVNKITPATLEDDNSSTRTELTVISLDTTVDTSNYKFDNNSISFDGNDYLVIEKNQITPDLSGDFTFEAWIRPSGTGDQKIFDFRGIGLGPFSDTRLALSDTLLIDRNNDDLRVFIGGTNRATGTGHINNSTWQHIAVQRQSGVINVWVDGDRWVDYADTTDYSQIFNYNIATGINADTTEITAGWQGHMDEIRWSTTARYTNGATITVPTTAFTDDADTILLLHGNSLTSRSIDTNILDTTFTVNKDE